MNLLKKKKLSIKDKKRVRYINKIDKYISKLITY